MTKEEILDLRIRTAKASLVLTDVNDEPKAVLIEGHYASPDEFRTALGDSLSGLVIRKPRNVWGRFDLTEDSEFFQFSECGLDDPEAAPFTLAALQATEGGGG